MTKTSLSRRSCATRAGGSLPDFPAKGITARIVSAPVSSAARRNASPIESIGGSTTTARRSLACTWQITRRTCLHPLIIMISKPHLASRTTYIPAFQDQPTEPRVPQCAQGTSPQHRTLIHMLSSKVCFSNQTALVQSWPFRLVPKESERTTSKMALRSALWHPITAIDVASLCGSRCQSKRRFPSLHSRSRSNLGCQRKTLLVLCKGSSRSFVFLCSLLC